jgi:hypothetical protein
MNRSKSQNNISEALRPKVRELPMQGKEIFIILAFIPEYWGLQKVGDFWGVVLGLSARGIVML